MLYFENDRPIKHSILHYKSFENIMYYNDVYINS